MMLLGNSAPQEAYIHLRTPPENPIQPLEHTLVTRRSVRFIGRAEQALNGTQSGPVRHQLFSALSPQIDLGSIPM